MTENESVRSDAKQNRARILSVARKAFVEDPEASLNFIAKAAKVGAGTLYRHFPNREALILELYRSEISEVATLASSLLHEYAAEEALRIWCDNLATLGKMKNGMARVLRAASSEEIDGIYGPLIEAVRKLLEACADSGIFRADIQPQDFLLLLGFLWQIPSTDEGQAQMARLLEVIFAGLRIK